MESLRAAIWAFVKCWQSACSLTAFLYISQDWDQERSCFLLLSLACSSTDRVAFLHTTHDTLHDVKRSKSDYELTMANMLHNE